MLHIDENFKVFLEDIEANKYQSPLEVPTSIWGSHGWELIGKKKVEEILLPFIRHNIERAKKIMPVYEKAYESINVSKIETMEDFYRVPALVKDSGTHGTGLRKMVKQNPYVMLPKDVTHGAYVFKSGGTRGVATPTFITKQDREIECEALKRSFEYGGLESGDRALTTYNPTHKGGEEIKETLLKLGITTISRRTNDTAKDVIKTIEDYDVNLLLAVQGEVNKGDKEQKGSGVSFLDLIKVGQDVIENKIKVLFLTGYQLIPEAIAWAETYNKFLFTVLGSSEAIPQATSTTIGPDNRLCRYNNLHVLNGPHFMEIVKKEDGVLVPVKKGETGILAYTTVAREGTLYIRYFPGDAATLLHNEKECSCGIQSEIWTGVHRIDIPDDVIKAGCCIGI